MSPEVKNAKRYRGSGIYVGRPTKWGNPFIMGVHGDRDEICDDYNDWIVTNEYLLQNIGELRGHHLICWCAPKRCHADTLLYLANDLSG